MAKKILLIEDEKDLSTTVSFRLSSAGYQVIAAFDGKEGFDLARKEKPDIIILDLMLPTMDGYWVCGLLKKDARYSKIPIILFTARAQDSDKKLGEDVGADAYIVKPFEPELLLGKIEELLKKNS